MSKNFAVEIPPDSSAVREHLREVLESQAFKGSRRSQQFLQHIVEKSIEGHADELKERDLGVRLFGRQPSYDTGEDAIVRVTASDVRKRLHHFYADANSEIRIEIPSGSYAPEFRRIAVTAPRPAPAPVARFRHVDRRVAFCAGIGLAALAFIGTWAYYRSTQLSARNMMPWSHMFQPGSQTVLVLSDPDISAVQQLTGWRSSLSDYANGKYFPDPESLDPGMRRALESFRGANVAAVDVGIAINIFGLATRSPARPKIRRARTLKLVDFKTDDDFIILGSPRSNPWSGLFQEALDFEFAYDENTKQEYIRNRRVQAGEAERYMPTARGWGTGRAFAMLAVVGNPTQRGEVLLLAGTSAEATEASGKLATDIESLSRSLKKCGIPTDNPIRHFEMLIEVTTMAGSADTFNVRACHPLPERRNL